MAAHADDVIEQLTETAPYRAATKQPTSSTPVAQDPSRTVAMVHHSGPGASPHSVLDHLPPGVTVRNPKKSKCPPKSTKAKKPKKKVVTVHKAFHGSDDSDFQ